MWEDAVEVATGPWLVGVRFESGALAAGFRSAFSSRVLAAPTGAPTAFDVRARAGVGLSVLYGERAVLRRSSPESLWEAMAWLLAGLAHAREGVGDTTSMRVVIAPGGAILLAAPRPLLLGAHAWAQAGLFELPLLRVAVDGDSVVLPDPSPWGSLGDTAGLAGRRLAILAVVARSDDGELREDTVERLVNFTSGDGAGASPARWADQGLVRTAGSRERLLRAVLRAAG